MWYLPRAEIKPVSPALAGTFLSTVPQWMLPALPLKARITVVEGRESELYPAPTSRNKIFPPNPRFLLIH